MKRRAVNEIFAGSIRRSEPVLRALSAAGLEAAGLIVSPDGALHVQVVFPDNDLTADVRQELNAVRRYAYFSPYELQCVSPDSDEDPAGLQQWTFTVCDGDTYGTAVGRAQNDFDRYPYSPAFTERVRTFTGCLRVELMAAQKRQTEAAQAVCQGQEA